MVTLLDLAALVVVEVGALSMAVAPQTGIDLWCRYNPLCEEPTKLSDAGQFVNRMLGLVMALFFPLVVLQ